MRAHEFIVEYRDRLLQYVKSLLPNYPEYVLKDWLVPNKGNFSNLPVDAIKNGIMEKLKGQGLSPSTKWQLVPDMKFTMNMFEPMTKERLIGRAGGHSDMGLDVPRDKERHATQATLAQQQGGVRKEPVLLIKTEKGYELLEGWHRTIQHFAKYPNGYTGPAYVAVAQQGVAEGKLVESAVFLNPTTVIVGQAHGQPLELSPNTLKKIQAIAAKHGAYYEGNGTDRSYTKGQIDRYVGSWDDEVAKTASPNDPKWLYVLFANVDENNRVQRVGVDPKDTIFNRLLTTAQDNSFQGIGYTAQALQKFLQMASEGKYDFVKMSQQPATQQNLTRFLKAGESLMWPSNWEQYPNRAGKIAKAATVDVRDQYLATRKAGVYVTGSGHLKAVQNITGQQAMTESLRVDVPNEDWLDDAIEYAKSHSPDRRGLPYMGKTTATVRKVEVPVGLLKRIPGMRNEQQNVRQADLAAIMKIMNDTGKLPLHAHTNEEYKPFINVAYDGSAWVNEGNHRIMAAAALGWNELPVEISYFDGGERVESGPMYPGKIGL